MNSRGDTFRYNGGSDEPGPVVVKLLATLQGIQRGKIEDKFGWNEEVKQVKKEDYIEGGAATKAVGGENIDKLP